GEISCRSNFLFTRGIQAIQGNHHGSSLLKNSYIPYQYTNNYLSSTSLGLAQMEKKMDHLTTYLHIPRTKRLPLSFWGDGGIVPLKSFFMLFLGVWRKLQLIGFS
ncbi:hypothetical protein AAZX31_08G225500, partial [Glycine max]